MAVITCILQESGTWEKPPIQTGLLVPVAVGHENWGIKSPTGGPGRRLCSDSMHLQPWCQHLSAPKVQSDEFGACFCFVATVLGSLQSLEEGAVQLQSPTREATKDTPCEPSTDPKLVEGRGTETPPGPAEPAGTEPSSGTASLITAKPDGAPISTPAHEDWEYQKVHWGTSAPALDSLIDMVGLEAVKARFVEISTLLHTRSRQTSQLSDEEQRNLGDSNLKLGAVFIGNPGVG
ncbi:hypothetical protein QBC43DRAFT_351722 [Cladorrhinum sp. PSN259]|nr:hypothetical protein QBC43DRAFT_351722 [Cladorrhinum sp. PSN259]